LSTTRVREWIIDGIDRTTWTEMLGLAQSLRHATAHGCLSASKVRDLKLLVALDVLVERLEAVTAGVLRRLNES
jgi:hypothetical protein